MKIIATDVVNGKEIVFKKGSMYDAMRASCSIPGLVRPFVYKKTQLVDGGVLNPLPLNHLLSPNQTLAVNLNETKSNIKNKKSSPTTQNPESSYFNVLKEYSFLIRKILSQKVVMKFLPKLLFRKDESFEYAEKIENLIKQTNK